MIHGRNVALIISSVLLFNTVCSAQPPVGGQITNQADFGKQEFDANCAVCHGPQGRGDGPYADLLKLNVPDLRTLSQKNGGLFPFELVYQTIDGRHMVTGHGTKQMPIWGHQYSLNAEKDYFTWRAFPGDAEAFVRARILALTEYISRLQGQSR
jgi:mono/diheme cytochrome c family protein